MLNPEQIKEKWIEQVNSIENMIYEDDGFDTLSDYLMSDKNTLFRTEIYTESPAELSPAKVVDWWLSILTQELNKQREEIKKEVEKLRKEPNNNLVRFTFNEALDQVLEILKK